MKGSIVRSLNTFFLGLPMLTGQRDRREYHTIWPILDRKPEEMLIPQPWPNSVQLNEMKRIKREKKYHQGKKYCGTKSEQSSTRTPSLHQFDDQGHHL